MNFKMFHTKVFFDDNISSINPFLFLPQNFRESPIPITVCQNGSVLSKLAVCLICFKIFILRFRFDWKHFMQTIWISSYHYVRSIDCYSWFWTQLFGYWSRIFIFDIFPNDRNWIWNIIHTHH